MKRKVALDTVKCDEFWLQNHQPWEDINLCYNKFKSYQ